MYLTHVGKADVRKSSIAQSNSFYKKHIFADSSADVPCRSINWLYCRNLTHLLSQGWREEHILVESGGVDTRNSD